MSTVPTAIHIHEIHKSFDHGRYEVFNGISLEIPKGKISFILGPSGVGKSVLLKHILGLLKPDRGKILIFNQAIPYDNPSKMNEMRKNFGVLFQGGALFDDQTVLQNVAFPLVEHRRDMKFSEMKKKVEEKLKAVGLDPKQTLNKLPNELSGGMKKRVALARAIVLEPQILLYDEPTTGLDPITRAMVDDLILYTNEKFGLTSIVITHDIYSALYSGDHIGFLHDGRIVFWGTPDEFHHCQKPIVQEFLQAEQKHRKDIAL